MVWPPSVQGSWSRKACAAKAESCATRKAAASCSRHPGELPHADRRQRGRRLALHARGQERAPPARVAHQRPRRPLHRARDQEGRGSPHGGVFLDISWIKEKLPNAEEHIKQEAPQHVPSVHTAGGHRHHQHADGSRTHHPLHDGRHQGGRRQPDVHRSRPVRCRRVRRRTPWRQPAGRKFAFGPAGLRQARRRVCSQVCASQNGRGQIDASAVEDRAASRSLEPFGRPNAAGEGPYQMQHDLQT